MVILYPITSYILLIFYYRSVFLTFFTSVSIWHVNRIDFTFHSNLYFDVQRWIVLLLPLLQLLVSSFRLEYVFFLFSHNDTPYALVYILLWLYWEHLFFLDMYLPIVFSQVVSVVSFHVIIPLQFVVEPKVKLLKITNPTY